MHVHDGRTTGVRWRSDDRQPAINGVFIPIAGVNQTVNLAGGGTVVINEHIRTGAGNAASLTVNGVRVSIPPLIAGTPAVANVILAAARSEIACGTTQ